MLRYKNISKPLILRYAQATFIIAAIVINTVHIPTAKADSYKLKTGYYIGSGNSTPITGLGFQPDFVMIKSTNTAGDAIIKTSAMPSNKAAPMTNAATDTTSQVTLGSDGFTIGTHARVNTVQILYYWVAIGGSDCTVTGSFCVGTYIGNGAGSRSIQTGFQPSAVIMKHDTAVAAHFRTESMPAGRSDFFNGTPANTSSDYLNTFGSTDFNVGSTDNTSGVDYYYVALKAGSSLVAVGSYTGDATDNRNITDPGFKPDVVFVKNGTSATTNNRRAVFTTRQHNGDQTSFTGDAVADSNNYIQELNSSGFQVGTNGAVNESGTTMYWLALGGDSGSSASGTYTMNTGSYVGTGAAASISGVGFAPDLVMIKSADAISFAVFRTRMHRGASASYFSAASVDQSTLITSLDSDGFTLGTDIAVNQSGTTYHWQAFGNAYNPYTNSGAADFAVGAYYGNSVDNRDIANLPFQPDLVVLKRWTSTAGSFRTSAMPSDTAGYFGATSEQANYIQSFNTDGFQVGTNGAVNLSSERYWWFAFKESSSFKVGTYTGNGVDNTDITSVGFQPELLWVKRTSGVNGVARPGTLIGDSAHLFANGVNISNSIQSLLPNGFNVGTDTTANANLGIYRYIAWKAPPAGTLSLDIVDGSGTSVSSPSFAMSAATSSFECTSNTGTLGSNSQRIRISNTSGNPAWTVSIAASEGSTALWRNGGNSQQYDFNDPAGSPNGCSDGGDSDNKSGQLSLKTSSATLSPQPGCTTSNVSLGSDQAFHEDIVNAVTIASASSGADTDCYWDLTGIELQQYIPPHQPGDSYNLNLTITTVAS